MKIDKLSISQELKEQIEVAAAKRNLTCEELISRAVDIYDLNQIDILIPMINEILVNTRATPLQKGQIKGLYSALETYRALGMF